MKNFPFENSLKPIQVDPVAGKFKFFDGDAWITIGSLVYCNPHCQGHVDLRLLEEFLEARQRENDSTKNWYLWGPRMN